MLKALLLLTVLSGYSHFQDKRLLLVFADKEGNAQLNTQQAIFKADPNGLAERDLEVRIYYADRDKALFEKKKIKAGFTVILVGKDGGDKLRSTKPLSLKTIFYTIDAMPMRQSEMRRHP